LKNGRPQPALSVIRKLIDAAQLESVSRIHLRGASFSVVVAIFSTRKCELTCSYWGPPRDQGNKYGVPARPHGNDIGDDAIEPMAASAGANTQTNPESISPPLHDRNMHGATATTVKPGNLLRMHNP